MTIQHIVDKPSRAALFLVLDVTPGGEDAVRDFIGGFKGLVKSLNFRYSAEDLFAVIGIGAKLWPRLTSAPVPAGLKEFEEISQGKHTAPSTPGDLLFHFRAESYDVCHELASQILTKLGDAVRVLDETQGFKYLDGRDLLGFVDGSANPTDNEALETVLLPEDADYPRSSYVTVQKYTHDLKAWAQLTVEQQEDVIGRSKVDDIEMDDDVKPSNSHVALNDLDEDIYRENMAFGSFASGEMGTYFIGYARDPEFINERLRNMFIGDPVGNYDRILDFSTAVTGTNFFVPSLTLMGEFSELPLP
ncbi:Dyp-type peroxidase [Corynebacterium phoceense]|uniref:Dyp-type peroxidase n=1 Tax=Corynebacterium phoceense TaxID=1686286 RepID=UPI00211C462D|nr:Dyp-type peroxidase [Corynebacterium phoceense]MCQ9330832.1 Dyp-type peroxidase [Corynebacterium phoceense]MCQ9339746.1 Dyp-type peroxidase [Corynebacterium phoceense]MCQ9347896.1 Dyp-type peroxidase [Corynebacterium phoceense]